MPVAIPSDAIAHAVFAFADANDVTARRMCRVPTLHETSLDQTFIEQLSRHSGPVQVGSGWVVTIETHNLGSGRHFGTWEIADIGVLVAVRHEGRLRLSKAAMLQSKRLYPVELALDEAEAHDYVRGIFRLWKSDEEAIEASRPRVFTFTGESEYKQLLAGDEQVLRIREFEQSRGAPVHYLLYNPAEMGWVQHFPIHLTGPEPASNTAGCRVVDAASIRTHLTALRAGQSATFDGIQSGLPPPYDRRPARGGWRVEAFVERVLRCQDGYVMEDGGGRIASALFGQRTGPISAAIAITFDAPGGAGE